jgi:hypothetical protein
MASPAHPVATHHLPAFITAPGETDVLMVIMGIILLLSILGFGILFFRLHSLPERIAHKSQRLQFEVVAVLGLISLFTHMHIFWVAGLLLALVEFPDFGTPLGRIARSTERIAGIDPEDAAIDAPLVPETIAATAEGATHAPTDGHGKRDRETNTSAPVAISSRPIEVDHA